MNELNAIKICVVGGFAVGKTSLVSRYAHGLFQDDYRTSVGVKIDTKVLDRRGADATRLIIWDIIGTDVPTELFLRYMRGASGYLLVADGTRAETLDRAVVLRRAIEARLGDLPWIGLVNKSDLPGQEVGEDHISLLEQNGEQWLRASARTAANVDLAFTRLIEHIRGRRLDRPTGGDT